MTDEQDKETSEQDEGAEAAGPVAGDGSPSSQAAGDDPPSTPPAEDAVGSEEGPVGEEKAEESEAVAEEPAAEEEETEEAPAAAKSEKKAEKKKDVIPGADLEPIAVEPEERPLSAEEQARREAEEEERRQREAALAGEAEEEPSAAGRRAPAKLEGGARYLATGKRKRAIARVIVLPGSGRIEVNKRPLEEFFPRPLHQTVARQPLVASGYDGSVDVRARVHGGGVGGQAGALRHGIARALTEIDPELRGELKRRGFLTRDSRVKERRKAGLKKARKKPQFSKR